MKQLNLLKEIIYDFHLQTSGFPQETFKKILGYPLKLITRIYTFTLERASHEYQNQTMRQFL